MVRNSWRRVMVAVVAAAAGWVAYAPPAGTQAQGLSETILFVSRQIPSEGSIYWDTPRGLPGVGAYSRLQVAAPGRLLIRESNGTIRTLINGAAPSGASLNLIDVSSADVSYDGQRIVFAGLPAGSYSTGAAGNPDAWRLYVINVDGSGLRQLTFDEPSRSNLMGLLQAVDDFDPAWLPDGRVVFSSTRWPSFGHYGGVRTSNLYVVNADGSNLHRITAERNGADRPVVDPLTGKIVFARWWRNHRFALNSMATRTNATGYDWKDGLSSLRDVQMDGTGEYGDLLWRNAWHIASIRPDGTDLGMWGGATGQRVDDERNHVYGGAFGLNGEFFANYFPMYNMTEAAGFGGIRRYPRGPQGYTPVIGITTLTLNYVRSSNPTSYGIFVGNYATDPVPLADGRLLISWAPDVGQDYGLYTINANGSGRTLVHNGAGTTEIRAKVVAPRPLPPMLADTVPTAAALRPPAATTPAGPFDGDGTFVFDALNVYFNAPVDNEIVSAPAVGSAATIRFFIDHQRTSPGSFPSRDWPILLKELPVAKSGAVRDGAAPANVPLFEQLRSPTGGVPFTGPRTDPTGAAHVAGMNYGRPGAVARCVGCHAGHTMIPVPANAADALWTNLAPGATVTVSSTRDGNQNGGLVDRKVQQGEIWRYWTSANGQYQNQWARLAFPVPIKVRTVRLYNPRPGDEANSSIQVLAATVRLYADAAATQQVASQSVGAVSVSGTDVPFLDVKAQAVRVEINTVNGTFYGSRVASLAEIEVIANANGDATTDTDGDTMPDDWEIRFGLNPNVNDAGQDADGDGVTNAGEYAAGTHPRGFHKSYFAEGATGTFFSTDLAILNPGSAAANVLLRYQRGDGYALSKYINVSAHSRASESVASNNGFSAAEFSTVLESDQPVVADRTMRWDGGSYGSHSETGVASPLTRWYFSEGATHSGFSTFYLLQNPGTTAAAVRITYLKPSGAPLVTTDTVAPGTRKTIWANQVPGLANTDVSAIVETTNGVAIIAERAMYLDRAGQVFGAGHESAGVGQPRTSWFFAEGATGAFFDLFLLLANPNASAAQVQARYLLPDGTTITRSYNVPANSRFNIWVDQENGLQDTAVSTTLTSTNGVTFLAERSMWWPGGAATWQEAHNSPGAASTGARWGIADAECGGSRTATTYVLVANTASTAASVSVTAYFEDATTTSKSYSIPGNSRFNVPVCTDLSSNRRFGVVVQSTGGAGQLVVERASYSNAGGITWAAGTNALASKLP